MKPKPTLADLPLRPELRGQEPYGAPQLDVPVRLNVNENPYPPSDAVIADMEKAVREAAAGINRYPDREAWELRTELAGYLGHGLTAENIWAANGSNEVMSQLLLAFGGPDQPTSGSNPVAGLSAAFADSSKPRKLLAFDPTYSMYPEYARNTHTEYVTLKRADDFTVGAGAREIGLIEACDPTVIVIASPNNPTGTTTPLSRIKRIATTFDKAIVVVDEAYQEFSKHPENTALTLLDECPNIVVSRTMSKAFAFAGGRLGYLATTEAVIDACRIVRLPYHLSAQTQALALVALRHSAEMLAQVGLLRRVRDEMLVRLPQLGVEVIDSDANFCLFGPFHDRHDVWQRLLDRGVLVRETGPEGWLRVSAGTPDEAEAFYAALQAILEEVR
jgi:histidinol-phosphate aminotransferase